MATSRLLLRRLAVSAYPSSTPALSSRPSGFLPLLTQLLQSTGSSNPFLQTCALRSYATAGTSGRAKPATSKRAAPKQKAAAPKKKPATKKKAAAKKKKKPAKKSTKKPASKRQVKKKTDVEILNAKVTALRKVALLDEPKRRPSTAWTLYNAEHIAKGNDGEKSMRENARGYHRLSVSQRESLNQTALNNRALNIRHYVDWVRSHTPDSIRLANNARTRLNRLSENRHTGSNKRFTRRYLLLRDERRIKRPASAMVQYMADRWASGEFAGMKLPDATRAMSAEWKSLTQSEKQKYFDAAEASKEKYLTDVAELYPSLAERMKKTEARKAGRNARRASTETLGR